MKIFGIETSSPLFSLCITDDNHLVHMVNKSRLHDGASRDGGFFQEAKHLLETSAAGSIGAIAVAVGPGMFTSLRVGLSLAKGIALARGIPLVGVNTLDVIGSLFFFIDAPVCAVINAYHEEIYAALYRGGKRITEYTLTTAQELETMLKKRTIIIGSGVDVIKKLGVSYACDCVFVDDEAYYPDAAKVVSVARRRILDRQYDNPDTLEPFYLKQTDAERNYNKKNAP